MSGVHGQMLGHLARRGVAVMDSNRDAYMKSLEHKSQIYDNSPMKDVKPWEAAVVFLTLATFMIVYASIKYTLGEVVASLAMIEQPRTLVVSEYRPVNDDDKDSSDVSQAQDRLLDEEVSTFKEVPITASIRQTVRHLASVGGYSARWRGISISVVYHFLQAVAAHGLAGLFSLLPVFGPFAFVFGSILSTVLLARIHMTWTHIMVSQPSPLPWYRRIPSGRTYFKALITPAFIFAMAQHLTVVLPLMVYFSFGPVSNNPEVIDPKHEGIRLIAMLATMAFVGIALLLPASVTLTRVEASLLPDDVETIVPFDRTLGGAAANLVGFGKINFRALYDAAWRSFDKASRIRLIKFYVKYAAILMALTMAFTAIITTEVAVLGGERLLLLTQNANAQMELSMMRTGGH
ncbi:hypothetical protein CAC42_2201 [Sphaceloma murrayae]|uniref:Uncharacterized protein n=1 Tax=Sphaceloma murrayae TaxID=2082308 RepID=A0A2K1QJ97_9PEZI|nr:hypothetical protein CAC42_2201 [Sphaceloma murrayae]